MMKILTVIGARPQFVKAAVLSRFIRERYSSTIEEILLHTGQHYDSNMSEVFFQEMDIPRPHINLEISGGSHGQMTGRMLELIEKQLMEHRPDYCLVYGDTNSTLAGALAASKIHIPVVHVEAGLRSFNRKMPEEINRILTDHISEFLMCPTATAVKNLSDEGVTKGVHKVGDIMLDASMHYRKKGKALSMDIQENFYLLTLHRAENTDDPKRLETIVKALNSYKEIQGILPLHPRTRSALQRYGLKFESNIQVIDPIGYLDMVTLEDRCKFIVTDSGGVQKEAWFFGKPCITLRDQTEWVETVEAGANVLVGADENKILTALKNLPSVNRNDQLFGSGNAASSMIDILRNEER